MLTNALSVNPLWRDYLELCKPKVVALMMLTTWVGMIMASTPGHFPFKALIIGSLGIGLTASAAAVLNHIVERHSDKHMQRTQNRPVAMGRVSPKQALSFALLIGSTGLGILGKTLI